MPTKILKKIEKMNKINSTILLLLSAFLFQNCMKDIEVITDVNDMTIENVIIPENFDFATSTDLHVSLSVPERLHNAVFSLIAFKSHSDSMKFAKATFDESGKFENNYTIPTYIDSILVQSEYLGLIDQIYVPVFDGTASFDYRPLYDTPAISAIAENEISLKLGSADGYTYMGSFNSTGLPSYLSGRDNIMQNLLDDINASLPERGKVPETNPEFLADNTETNIILTKKADVWVTFVAEGASYRNSLGT